MFRPFLVWSMFIVPLFLSMIQQELFFWRKKKRYTHTRTLARAHTRTHMHARTHTHTRTHARTHARTHTHTKAAYYILL